MRDTEEGWEGLLQAAFCVGKKDNMWIVLIFTWIILLEVC
jgi:hypothetical protein